MRQSSYDGTPSLYLIPTPIGNLDDITVRALKILEKLGLVRTQTTNDQFIYSHCVPRYYFEGKWIYD